MAVPPFVLRVLVFVLEKKERKKRPMSGDCSTDHPPTCFGTRRTARSWEWNLGAGLMRILLPRPHSSWRVFPITATSHHHTAPTQHHHGSSSRNIVGWRWRNGSDGEIDRECDGFEKWTIPIIVYGRAE
jgi:hypothetical protein